MSDWRPMHDAPRDREISLFLPGMKFRLDASRKPVDIEHGECVGMWDVAQTHWVDAHTKAKVYPSQWRAL